MLIQQNIQEKSPTRLVVLGSSGFVGKAIIKEAIKRQIAILPLSSKDIDLCADDAADKLAKILHNDDCVVFCSAIDNGSKSGSEDLINNIKMAHSVEKAAKITSFAHLIYLSSESVYSYENGLISENTPTNPTSLYGIMHRTRELILSTQTSIPLSILRLTAIYGDGDTHNAYGPNRFTKEAAKDKKITIFGNGEEMRDHFYVEDVATCVIKTASQQTTGILNLATGFSVSFYDIAQYIANKTGAIIQNADRQQAISHRHFDVSTRLKLFPYFVPKMIDSYTC